MRGMLKGFIDLVFRHEGRYYLLDYKSNWLGKIARPTPGRRWSRRCVPTATIYSISCIAALHRYLRHRLADYDYDRHFGGVIYLSCAAWTGRRGQGSSPPGRCDR